MEVLRKVGASYSAEELQQTATAWCAWRDFEKLTAPAALDLLERSADLPTRVNIAGAQAVAMGMLRGWRPARSTRIRCFAGIDQRMTVLKTQQ